MNRVTTNHVTAGDVVQVFAEMTGIPTETLSGEIGEADYEAALPANVVGQPESERAVATEIQLIKAGLNEPGQPASVLLLAGMTSVRKRPGFLNSLCFSQF